MQLEPELTQPPLLLTPHLHAQVHAGCSRRPADDCFRCATLPAWYGHAAAVSNATLGAGSKSAWYFSCCVADTLVRHAKVISSSRNGPDDQRRIMSKRKVHAGGRCAPAVVNLSAPRLEARKNAKEPLRITNPVPRYFSPWMRVPPAPEWPSRRAAAACVARRHGLRWPTPRSMQSGPHVLRKSITLFEYL